MRKSCIALMLAVLLAMIAQPVSAGMNFRL
jgi:hypothetical protein